MTRHFQMQFYRVLDSEVMKEIAVEFIKAHPEVALPHAGSSEYYLKWQSSRVLHDFFNAGSLSCDGGPSSIGSIKKKIKASKRLSAFFKYIREKTKLTQSEAIDAVILNTLKLEDFQ